MSSLLLTCFGARRSAAFSLTTTFLRQRPLPHRPTFDLHRTFSSVRMLREEVPRESLSFDDLEGQIKTNHSDDSKATPLTRTAVRQMKVNELRTELGIRGLDATGNRPLLVERLLADVGDVRKQKGSRKPRQQVAPVIHPDRIYVLRVRGQTTQTSGGTGIGLVLYDPSLDERRQEVWSGRIYMPGYRTTFEAEYSASITGMDYVNRILGARQLLLQTSSEGIVKQIRGTYQVSKPSLKKLLELQQKKIQDLDDFDAQAIPAAENERAAALANKALKTRKSFILQENLLMTDPIEETRRSPDKSEQNSPEQSEKKSTDNLEPNDTDKPKQKDPDPPSQSTGIDPSRTYMLRFDGGSRGNPGIAGAGMVIYDDTGREIWSGWKFHTEEATNNVAEYLGLLCGIQSAMSLGIRHLKIEGDSQLIVKQIHGEYRCKQPTLKVFYNAVLNTMGSFESFDISHIPRAQNSRADSLANQAMDLKDSGSFSTF